MTVKQTFSKASFYVRLCTQDGQIPRATVESLKTIVPDILVTVGSTATETARREFPEVPIVFSSVLYPELSGFAGQGGTPKTNITGASLDVSIEMQFRHFKSIIPKLKRIGVLYTSSTAPLIAEAARSAADSGLRLVAIQISDERDIPEALDSLSRTCQGLWSIADPTLFTPQSTRYILLNTLKKGLPVMGFSKYVVESGALFALDFDYKAIGRQAGVIVTNVLNGARPSSIPVTSPDVIWFHYNERTASHIGVTIPPDLIAVAKEVYR